MNRSVFLSVFLFPALLFPGLPLPGLSLQSAAAHTFTVRLAEGVEPAARSGRILLFFVDVDDRRVGRSMPIEAPFYESPQPIASIAVRNLLPGDEIVIDGSAVAWPVPVTELEGRFRIQAVFRCNPQERSHKSWGNPRSGAQIVDLVPGEASSVTLTLDAVESKPKLEESENLRWVELRSELVSRARGHDVTLRAGVALPPGYHDINHRRREWPVVYVVPGFGGRHEGARRWADTLHTPSADEFAPSAIYVVLDPESPLGHHGFADSEGHGPYGTALVTELIPHIEERFRIVARPEARIITGHSSGGWSSLWLALHHPDVFGACWSSAPDPVDFTAFQLGNLYEDENLFTNEAGHEIPSYRLPLSPDLDRILMTVRQEVGMERAMAPDGRSGEQWGTWMALFSTVNPRTRAPLWVADPESGVIDRNVVERDWSRRDIGRLVEADWPRFRDALSRVRLACGLRDSYYLENAVLALRERVWRLEHAGTDEVPPLPSAEEPEGAEIRLGDGPGYIWLVRHATHDTIVPLTTLRWGSEMIEHFRAHGLN